MKWRYRLIICVGSVVLLVTAFGLMSGTPLWAQALVLLGVVGCGAWLRSLADEVDP